MNNKKILGAILVGVFGCLLAGYFLVQPGGFNVSEKRLREDVSYRVTYVNDGDTFVVADEAGHELTIRMLGIDTPETVDPRKGVMCYGPEASSETKSLLQDRRVNLKANPDREARDRYGRYLAYVYRDDGLFMNEHLLVAGFAREYTYGKPYSFQKAFKEDEAMAKRLLRGLWGKCASGASAFQK